MGNFRFDRRLFSRLVHQFVAFDANVSHNPFQPDVRTSLGACLDGVVSLQRCSVSVVVAHDGDPQTAKAITVVRGNKWNPVLLTDCSTDHCVVVKLEGPEINIVIVNVYAEPGRQLDPILEQVERTLSRYRCPAIVAGDFNAKNPVWGGSVSEARGNALMDLVGRHRLEIANNSDDLATFSSANGQSWIDVTLGRNVNIAEWKVDDDESLSDHRYIRFSVPNVKFQIQQHLSANLHGFNARKADCNAFKRRST